MAPPLPPNHACRRGVQLQRRPFLHGVSHLAWAAALPAPPASAKLATSYVQPGPYAVNSTSELVAESVSANVFTPDSAKKGAPLFLFTPGFQCKSSQYDGLMKHVASHGFVAASYDVNGITGKDTDLVRVDAAQKLVDVLLDRTTTTTTTTTLVLAGHSRGAKLSALLATKLPSTSALLLIDPVDASDFAPISDEYPSALQAIRDSSTQWSAAAVICADRAGACAPVGVDGDAFYDVMARGKHARSLIRIRASDATHFGALDAETFTQASACPGPATRRGADEYRMSTRAVACGVCASALGEKDALSLVSRELTAMDAANADEEVSSDASTSRYAARWRGGRRLVVDTL